MQSTFKDNLCGQNVKKCYIGNSEVYKDYLDFNKPMPEPDCMGTKGIFIDNLIVTTKITPAGDVEQETDDIKWMSEKSRWKGIKTIGMVQNTIEKDGKISIERRYYISSEKINIELFEKCCRGHWAIEIMHWHLDVTFREDANQTLDKIANQNLNIIRKWVLTILKTVELSEKPCSLKRKRFRTGMNPAKYIQKILEI